MHFTVVGRTKEDTKKYGKEVSGFIGKHIVGTGEDAHLTTNVYFDFLRPHVVLCCGKRGTGKSYSAGVILEEFCELEEEYRNKMAFVVIDPVGIYWSIKFPNEQQEELLKKWGLNHVGYDNVRVIVPEKQAEEYEKAGIPIDEKLSISLKEFTAEDLIKALGLKRTEKLAIALEKNFSKLEENGGIEDLIGLIKDDMEVDQETKNALSSLLNVLSSWGLISGKGIGIEKIVRRGMVNVIDVSRMKSSTLRDLLVSFIAKRILEERIVSRKEEEKARIEGEKVEVGFPITWLVLEEAHNFVPSDGKSASTEPLIKLAKEGREPGIGLLAITQIPDKIHRDVLSQCDIVISFRLTNRSDISALHSIYHTYMPEDVEKYIGRLPRGWVGAAIIFDDTLEKIFTVQVRPRKSWHAGGTAFVA